jgi:cytochrome P450
MTMSSMTDATAATAHWGAHDQDDPFPVMAHLREQGAVHRVMLADGHAAWLVVGYDEARGLLNDPRLSKDMHAALARDADIVAEGLPGPALARHMLNVDPPDHTRLGVWCRVRSRRAVSTQCSRGSRRSSTPSSTASRPAIRIAQWIWWRCSRFRCLSP